MKRRAAAAGAAVIGSAAAYLLAVRPWQLRWGATDEERDATLDGDDLIPNPDLMATRAITVHAVAEHVCTWSFGVREQPDGTTRLLVRERYVYTQRWAGFLVEPVAVAAFVMSQRMLRGIRDRAERAGRPTA